MRRLLRIVAGLAGIACGGLILLFVIAAAFLSTQTGRDMAGDQTESLVEAALGPGYVVELGSQRFGIDARGYPGIDFSDLTVSDPVTHRRLVKVDRVETGVSLVDLVLGRLSLRSLSVRGVHVDEALLAHWQSGAALDPAEIFAALDQTAAQLARLPLKDISIADIRLGGDARPIAVRDVRLSHGKDAGLTFAIEAAAFGHEIDAAGTAALGPGGAKLARLRADAEVAPSGSIDAPDDGFDVPLRLALELQGGTSGRELVARAEAGAGTIGTLDRTVLRAASLRASLRESGNAIAIDAAEADFGPVQAEMAGSVALVPDADGRYPFSLHSRSMRSRVGVAAGAPARAGSFSLSGAASSLSGPFAIDALSIAAAGGHITGSATAAGLDPGSRIRLHLQASNVATPDVKAFWPFFISDDARDWMLEHAGDSGAIDAASIDMDITKARLEAICVPDVQPTASEVQVSATMSGVGFATEGEMPRIEDVSGRIATRGGDTSVSIDKGSPGGVAGVVVLPSTIDFTHGDTPGTEVALGLNLSGDASAIVGLAARKPVEALKDIGWTADDISGQARVGVGASFHLAAPSQAGADSQPRLKNWSVVADLKDVDLKKPVSGRRLRDLTGMVMAAPGHAMGDLHGTVDGIAAEMSFSQPLAPEGKGGPSLTLTATLHDSDLKALSSGLADVVVGPVTVKATKTATGLHVAADLTPSELKLPAIGWKKGPGVPASLNFDLSGGGIKAIRNAKLVGEGFAAEGSGEIDAAGLKRLSLDKLAFNRGDSLSARIDRVAGGGMAITVSGQNVDARPLLARLRTGLGSLGGDNAAAGSGKSSDALSVTVEADRMLGFGNEALNDASIRYSGGKGASPEAFVEAKTPEGKAVRFSMVPQAGRRSIALSADDAGLLLRFAGLYPRMSGGHLQVRLQGSAAGDLAGPVVLNHFSLVDEPRLKSLVGTTRPNGNSLASAVGEKIKVQNAYFDTAKGMLAWRDGRLTVDAGILRGPVFGSSFEGLLYDAAGRIDMSGSFMPAYRYNRLFGALPFVGGILGNGGEGGLIGITYRLSGAIVDPTLTVNPVSLIAPGIFRRIFEY
ncbi:hypothetical protein [Jiella sp. M17.18]|uniref:hypothetical protein n=1 Tax=Jiella sp. M17.18 TaxID=3234247 RepID=UPI0034E04900